MTLCAVIHARRSSDRQSAASIGDRSRLCRNQADIASLCQHLGFAGLAMVTLAEGRIDKMHSGLIAMQSPRKDHET